MKTLLRLFLLIMICIITTQCRQTPKKQATISSEEYKFTLPDWAKNAVIYEVNVRQFTPEGTFNGLSQHVDRIAKMGVDILWLMPIYPISEKNRKATNELLVTDIKDENERSQYLGSPYAVADYKAVNPDLGTSEDFKRLVQKIHQSGMRIILDYVPNHTGWDNQWIFDHPEWYTKDAAGNIIDPIDPGTGKSWGWTDVADLNYDVQEMRDAQLDALLFWVEDMQVDGFRQDVAHNVPVDFWQTVSKTLVEANPDVFLLAEAEQTELRNKETFHADYGWEFHHLMNDIAKGHKDVSHIDEWYTRNKEKNHKGFHIHFTSNHDENTWNGTVFDRMGDAHKALAVLSATFDGMPLLYGGQEEPMRHRLGFFTKDDIGFKSYAYTEFYKTLFELKDRNQAIWNGEYGGELVKLTNSESIYGFGRQKNGDRVVVFINLSDKPAKTQVRTDVDMLSDIFTNESFSISSGEELELDPWEYIVASSN